MKLIETEKRWVAAHVGSKGDAGPEIQTSGDKISKLWGANAPHGDYSWQYRVPYLRVAKREDLKCFHHVRAHTHKVIM